VASEERNPRLKIAHLTVRDPTDRNSWSGTNFTILKALEEHCGDVTNLGPLHDSSEFAGRALRKVIGRLTGKTFLYTHRIPLARRLARAVEAKLHAGSFDVIFCSASSTALAYLETDLPVVYLSDATIHLLVDYYQEFRNLWPSHADMANEIERRAIANSTRLIYPSAWAAQSAISDYHADPRIIDLIPFGANLQQIPDRQQALRVPPSPPFRLLFVGTNWQRKGGDIALETIASLRELGIPAHLTIVGAQPPASYPRDLVTVIPFIDKNDPEKATQLAKIYRDSHLFLLPTRADCSPIVLSEANAYGLPAISTNTGGVTGIVREGINGYLLAPEARGRSYAERIAMIYNDPALYAKLREGSRMEYETSLNWPAWGQAVSQVLRKAILAKSK